MLSSNNAAEQHGSLIFIFILTNIVLTVFPYVKHILPETRMKPTLNTICSIFVHVILETEFAAFL